MLLRRRLIGADRSRHHIRRAPSHHTKPPPPSEPDRRHPGTTPPPQPSRPETEPRRRPQWAACRRRDRAAAPIIAKANGLTSVPDDLSSGRRLVRDVRRARLSCRSCHGRPLLRGWCGCGLYFRQKTSMWMPVAIGRGGRAGAVRSRAGVRALPGSARTDRCADQGPAEPHHRADRALTALPFRLLVTEQPAVPVPSIEDIATYRVVYFATHGFRRPRRRASGRHLASYAGVMQADTYADSTGSTKPAAKPKTMPSCAASFADLRGRRRQQAGRSLVGRQRSRGQLVRKDEDPHRRIW
jgi:hypothetical protein